jgi:hypothetical protein
MNRTLPQWRTALTATILLLFFSAAYRAAAIDGLLLQDTYVDSTSNKAAINYGASGDLRVFKSSTASMRAFLKFSIATLPAGTTAADIKQARLRLWVNSSSTITGAITLTPVTSAWSETTLTNNTSASMTFGLPKHADLPISSIGNFVSIDVTDWVQAWLAGTLANQGFVIETSTTSATLNLYFDSKESSLTSHEPQIDITLIGPAGPQGPSGPQGPTGATGAQGPAGATGLQGPVGATGAAGAQGSAGATGPTGPKALNWKGAWSSSIAYVLNDAVFAGGSAYMALQANTNVQPPAPGTWDLVAQRGDAGADGAQGPAGPAGSQGPAGAQGPEGPAGPMGPPGLDGQTGQPGEAGPIGPPGETGPQGEPGQVGEQGVPGAAIAIRYAYSTDTTNSNPGAGLVRFNAAICGNATEIYVSYIDADANAWPAVLSSLADSSSTTKGQLRFINLTNTHGTPVLFNLISVSEAPGYHILGVTPVTVGYGPFSIDGEGALLVFNRTGDKGDTGSTGSTGAQGPAGPQGLTGETGAAGPAGLTGPAGPAGPQGPVGPGGDPGAAGPAGPQGPPGPVLTRVEAQGDLSMGEFTQGPTP